MKKKSNPFHWNETIQELYSNPIKYDIQYESIKDVIDDSEKYWFIGIKECANRHKVELSDEDFMRLLKIARNGKDYDWILHQMGTYNKTLVDALVSYIVY